MSDYASLSDEALLLAYQKGAVAAFDQLYLRHKNTVYRMVLRQCSQSGVADELSQEIWMRVIAASDNYVVSAKFTTWLYRIVQNRVIDYTRSGTYRYDAGWDEAAEHAQMQLPAPSAEQPEALALRSENIDTLLTAIDTLPAPQREAVLLHFEGEFDLEEIAQITQTSRETVKSRIRYGVAKLRTALTELAAHSGLASKAL